MPVKKNIKSQKTKTRNVKKKLVKKKNSVNSKIKLRSNKKLLNINGLGPKVIDSIISYFHNKANREIVLKLDNILMIKSYQKVKSNNEFSGKNIVFTGTLSKISRDEAKHIAIQLGAKILNSVTKKADYLICGTKPGSKVTKAQELNVKILSENEWILKTNE